MPEIPAAHPGSSRRQRLLLVARHTRITRLTHWINLLCVIVLLMSGLQIFNAHPALYWGQIGADPGHAAFEIGAAEFGRWPACGVRPDWFIGTQNDRDPRRLPQLERRH